MKSIRLSSTTKRVIVVAAVIAIVGAGWLWMQRGSHGDDALRLYGNVDIREVQLAFRQSGRVAQMLFDEGDLLRRSFSKPVFFYQQSQFFLNVRAWHASSV